MELGADGKSKATHFSTLQEDAESSFQADPCNVCFKGVS